jgi:hypothetical protein
MEYALPDVKVQLPIWPDTPTPSHAVANKAAMPSPLLRSLMVPGESPIEPAPTNLTPAKTSEQIVLAPSDLPLQAIEGPYHAPAQTCPALSEMLVSGAVGPPIEGQYVVLQAFPAYEAHNVNESLVMHASQPWGCEFDDVNNSGGCYTAAVQWPSFAIPQPGGACIQPDAALEPVPQSIQLEASPPSQANALSEAQSQKQAQHNSGQCRPCAWFWREKGCQNGDACGYCHLCPEGELKARKKNKITAMRMGALTPMKASTQSGSGWGLKLDSLIQD